MDIGNQQRVIIVELDTPTIDEPANEEPAELSATNHEGELDEAVAWPLPLDLDPEPVS